MNAPTPLPPVADEQLRYARWLDWGAKVGFATLVVGFLAYWWDVIIRVLRSG